MNRLNWLHYRQRRVEAMIDELNILASSTSSEQNSIKIDFVAALEKLRSELIEVREEFNMLVETETMMC